METPEDECPSYDRDCDSISDAVELNSANDYLNLDVNLIDQNPTLARGGPCDGWITKALNMVNTGTGYYHYNIDPPGDIDDWGVLRLIYMIERASRAWTINNGTALRVGIGDLSLKEGGLFPPHSCHQNGLEVDIRYVRNDGKEDPLNLNSVDSIYYDEDATIRLVHHLIAYGNADSIYVDTLHTNLNHLGFSFIAHKSGHSDHFHTRIEDPDGTAN